MHNESKWELGAGINQAIGYEGKSSKKAKDTKIQKIHRYKVLTAPNATPRVKEALRNFMETGKAWFQPLDLGFSYCHIDLYAPSVGFETQQFECKVDRDSVQLLIHSFFIIVSPAKTEH